MDVTPGPKMFEAMSRFVDSVIGEKPNPMLIGPEANKIRAAREEAFNFLHKLVGLAMREGVNRAVIEARKHRAGILAKPQDDEDASARALAKDDAEAGKSVTDLRGARPLKPH